MTFERPTEKFFCYSMLHWKNPEKWYGSKKVKGRIHHLCTDCKAAMDANKLKNNSQEPLKTVTAAHRGELMMAALVRDNYPIQSAERAVA